MRTTFFNYVAHQAEIDPTLYLIVGDVGFSVIETFEKKFPTRFINAGIAEQNMIGVAAGLAMAGKNVYVYSIVPFVTMRCFEQIRNNICYQKLNVKIIGWGGGFSYGASGSTHHAIEDIAIMRSLPTMTVVAPGNKFETEQLLPQINTHTGPTYIRLANNEELVTYPTGTDIQFGKAIDIIPHESQYIIATGNALDLGFQVQQYLQTQGLTLGLVSMPTIKPLDHDFLITKKLTAVFTIEEHSIIGGLGEAVAHVLCEQQSNTIFHTFGINDCYPDQAGNRNKLKELAGLSVETISTIIVKKLKRVHGSIQIFSTPKGVSKIHPSTVLRTGSPRTGY